MPRRKQPKKPLPPRNFFDRCFSFIKNNRSQLVAVLVFIIATVGFMWPMVTRPATYSEGGDHMFNAWTLARNHHCLLRQGCPTYTDGNIFFPNKDSMLFSETQLSASLLTLPLHFINDNPLFAANIWYVVSMLLSGLFMYFLARYLSKGNQLISMAAGLVFEFGPNKFSSVSHLQNLSIFYVPLIILMLLKYRDTGQKKYLSVFGISSALLFLASWYQMVFGLVIIGLFVGYMFIDPKQRTKGFKLAGTTLLAILITIPLALQYTRFSKSTNAGFSINNQIEFSASVNDYLIPLQDTPLGSLYYKINPEARRNSYNPDSYSYAGISLYVVALFCLFMAVRKRVNYFTKQRPVVLLLFAVALAGFVISLGPIIKYGSHSSFPIQGIHVSIPAPYLLVDVLVPQLSFIRAIGRAAIITLFALCCALAIYGAYLGSIKDKKRQSLLTIGLFVVIVLDVVPVKTVVTRPFQPIAPFQTQYSVPNVYRYVAANPAINNIVIARTQKDYPKAGIPTAPAEDVLWAGYHNRNIFNGYSGYEPPQYRNMLQDFTDLQPNDVSKLKAENIHYYLIDKQLSVNQPSITDKAQSLFGKSVYQDSRYALFKI